jgi:large subunit ribosomal protein L24
MLLDSKTGKPTRVKTRIDKDGTKERVGVKSGEVIPRSR